MNIETTKINAANAIAKGKIALKDLESKLESIAQKASKNLKIDGFRKGKVPTHIIKSRYKDSMQQDAERESIQEMLKLALEKLGLKEQNLIGNPVVSKFEKGKDDIEVEIKISIVPEFELGDYESKIPTPKIPTPTEKQIKERLENLASSNAPLIESASKSVKNDLVANIDFEGFVDGVAFDGGKAEGFDLAIGSGHFIAGFEEALIGAKIGEQKEISVTFPSTYHAPNLAGKPATFKVKINALKEKAKQVIDDALAKKLMGKEDATLKELESSIKDDLTNELKTQHYNEEMKSKFLEALDSSFGFDLPEIIVEQEMDILFRNALSTISQDELKTYQQDAKKAKDKREEYRQEAQSNVKVTFIIDAIAKAQNITIDDREVMNAIYYEALISGQNPKEVLEYYQKNNLLPAIKMSLIENRVLHTLLDKKAGLGKNAESTTKENAKKAESKNSKAKNAESKADSTSSGKSKSTASKHTKSTKA